MPDELKPCPFCGADGSAIKDKDYYFECFQCGAQGPYRYVIKPEEWNTRPAEAALQTQVAALTGDLGAARAALAEIAAWRDTSDTENDDDGYWHFSGSELAPETLAALQAAKE